MPRILVVTSGRASKVVHDELVTLDHLNDEHSASQVLERLAWGLQDAQEAEERFKEMVAPRSYREISA
jgi:hypothetical protein